jgi:outer membrane protein OmpA-like peptidoglycan-associated protein/tetratricopeptide (TPR) repeat protein
MQMNPINIKAIIVSVIFLLNQYAGAQTIVEQKAKKAFDNMAYKRAAELFEMALERDPGSNLSAKYLAESYRKLNDFKNAEKAYLRVFDFEIQDNEDYLYYAQAMFSNGRRDQALEMFKKYAEIKAGDKRGQRYIESIKNYKDLYINESSYSLELTPFNSERNHFSPIYFNKGLLMPSDAYLKSYNRSPYNWNGLPYLNLYYLPFLSSDSLFGAPERLPNIINSKYNEGPASFNKEQTLMAFSRNNFYKGRIRRSIDGINKIKIFFADHDKGKWSKVRPFEHNNDQYSVGHPALSADGKTMYFVSDMPGGYGGTDLYVSKFAEGKWSRPMNLGPEVNSEGNEMFPFVLNDSLLYFSSNGLGGLGGLDVFYSEIVKEGNFPKPTNVGYPVNSFADDFGYIYNADTKIGFFTSNRDGGMGGDDIYRFRYSPKPMKVLVANKKTNKPLPGARLEIYEEDRLVAKGVADEEGFGSFFLKACTEYRIVSELTDYPTEIKTVQTVCPLPAKEPLVVLMYKLELKGNVYDRYLNRNISEAEIELTELESNKVIANLKSDTEGNFSYPLLPCKEYKIVARSGKLPQVEKTFKSSCDNADDSYVNLLMGIQPEKGVFLSIAVLEEQSGEAISGAKIRLINNADGTFVDLIADDEGKYETVIKENQSFQLAASKIGFFSTSKSKSEVKTTSRDRKIFRDLRLLRLKEGGIIALEGIFYDLGKFNIRPDAARVLDYVVQVMEENPSMKIELGSHTDSRGSDADNLVLSENRAKAAAEYIVSKGIAPDRITGKGYGETQLKNRCGNGVKCSEAEHQMNRRTEIKILDY